jgi:hypothetical protein
MERPDIEALLKQNPGIDPNALQRYLEEQAKRIVQKPQRRGNTSPYSGRRLTPSTKVRWTSARKVRSHYRAF